MKKNITLLLLVMPSLLTAQTTSSSLTAAQPAVTSTISSPASASPVSSTLKENGIATTTPATTLDKQSSIATSATLPSTKEEHTTSSELTTKPVSTYADKPEVKKMEKKMDYRTLTSDQPQLCIDPDQEKMGEYDYDKYNDGDEEIEEEDIEIDNPFNFPDPLQD